MSDVRGPDGAESLPTTSRLWPFKRYTEMHARSIQDPERFWAEEARKLDWYKTWDRVLDWDPPYGRWFVGGWLNACYQCVDRHAASWRRSKVAIYWEGETGQTRVLSYSTLFREVKELSHNKYCNLGQSMVY
jgi:acetyl-CoA synthetase